MKTYQYTIVAVLLMTGLSFAGAQSNYGEFKWGLTGGINFASMNDLQDADKDKGKVGLVGGAFFKFPLSQKLSIRPELLFHMKGATLIFYPDAAQYEEKINLNYVEVPVSLDFELRGIFDLHAGVQGAFLLGKKFKVNGEKIDVPDDQLNKTEFGYHVGTGIDLGNIGIHVRFHQSLTSFMADNIVDFGPRNWGITLTGSYMFIN